MATRRYRRFPMCLLTGCGLPAVDETGFCPHHQPRDLSPAKFVELQQNLPTMQVLFVEMLERWHHAEQRYLLFGTYELASGELVYCVQRIEEIKVDAPAVVGHGRAG